MDIETIRAIEKKWQQEWSTMDLYTTKEPSFGVKKLYILDMFPYPSGAGLHVGHLSGWLGTDVYSRYHRMNGTAVLHPMGWDAFGLPAENYAIKTGVHPKITTKENVDNFRKQLAEISIDYDWSREVNTTDPSYYKWTQWIFLQLFKKGLAYEAKLPINWCTSCLTGLANEEVVNGGECERCGSRVEQKMLRQWVLKITEYAERLLEDLDDLDWPESIKEMQRNWIGRSTGCTFHFEAYHAGETKLDEVISVFTTRIDTAFGVTFMAIAPEHPLVDQLTLADRKEEVDAYVEQAKKKSQLERTELQKKKTGVFTGSYAKNPFDGTMVPVYVCDYVLGFYGTGAVMAVPAHDERDWEFAEEHDLDITRVVTPLEHRELEDFDAMYKKADKKVRQVVDDIEARSITPVGKDDEKAFPEKRADWLAYLEKKGMVDDRGAPNKEARDAYELWSSFLCTTKGKEWMCTHQDLMRKAFTDDGMVMASGEFSGLPSDEARRAMITWLESKGLGEGTVNYKLRDWVFSRQRYWGEPIPLVHCDGDCGVVPIPESELPLELPEVEEYQPTGTGESPLAAIEDWVTTTCPSCGGPGKRETNTMPQWAGSCWYYLRFIDPDNDEALADPQKLREWLPVDMYVGGAEHAVLHLLYSRFWHKVLYDIGAVPTKEPFQTLKNQGLILAEDGSKMSKSKGNVVNPLEVVEKHGSDVFRMYMYFMGPYEAAKPWSSSKIQGIERFLQKLYRCHSFMLGGEADKEEAMMLHKTIKKVTEDIEAFSFNTAISQCMVFVNAVLDKKHVTKKSYMTFLQLLAPFAPHATEELWQRIGGEGSIHQSTWPRYEEAYTVQDIITIVVQINGKIRGEFEASKEISKEDAIAEAKNLEGVQKYLEGAEIRKEIYVPGKLVSLVV